MPILILIGLTPVFAALYMAASCFRSGGRLEKWGSLIVLGLLVLPLLAAGVGWTALAAMDLEWRSGVKTACGLCYTAGVLLLLAWAGRGMIRQFCVWGELANTLIGCVIVLADVALCILVGLWGLLLSSVFGSDHVVEWEEELVVVRIDAWDSRKSYHAYRGPLVRGSGDLEEIQPPYYADAKKAKRQVSQELSLELPPSDVEFYEDTHGGFLGDGTTYIRLRFYDGALPEDFWYDVHWHTLPLTENLAGQVPRINGEAACALEAEKGYYYFRDRHSEAEHDWDEEPIMGRFSWNFTLAVYDTDTRTLHFLKLDT